MTRNNHLNWFGCEIQYIEQESIVKVFSLVKVVSLKSLESKYLRSVSLACRALRDVVGVSATGSKGGLSLIILVFERFDHLLEIRYNLFHIKFK